MKKGKKIITQTTTKKTGNAKKKQKKTRNIYIYRIIK